MKTSLKPITACLGMVMYVSAALAAEPDPSSESTVPPASGAETLFEEIKRGFYSRVNILAYGIAQKPKNTLLNPNNSLDIPRYEAVLNPRVDINQDFRQLELGIKMRYLFSWQKWEEGERSGTDDYHNSFYVNEWFARFRIADELIASYGRENLQWGPSVILSSSNPFNQENGKNNSRIEVPGIEYARVLWIPSSFWTVSAIANTGKGRSDSAQGLNLNQTGFADQDGQNGFKRSYALKIDYTGEGKFASLIPSYREDGTYRVGYNAGWNVSDALLVYSEGSLNASRTNDFQLQAGASYTFEAGPTINLEYYRNNDGCSESVLARCFLLGIVRPDDFLLRKDYLMFQYTDTRVWTDLNLNLKAIYDINDSSTRLIGTFEYEVGDNIQLYLTANGFTGHGNSEYGSILRYSVFAGFGYTF